MSQIETIITIELVPDTYHLTQKYLCSYQDDAIECYDHTIKNFAMLNSRKFGVPSNIFKVRCHAYDNIQLKTQIRNQISKIYTKAQNS